MTTGAPTAHSQFHAAMLSHHGGSLAHHLQACATARGRWFDLHCLLEQAHAALAPRFCTTVLGAVLLLTLLSSWVGAA